MPGRVTFRHAGRFPAAWWARERDVPRKDWSRFEEVLARPLADVERELIRDWLQTHHEIAHSNRSVPSSQDIKATLAALARLPVDEVASAYGLADGWTKARIAGAMLRAGIREQRLADPSADQIRRFSAAAVKAWKPSTGGRRSRDTLFAQGAWALWRALSGTEYSASARTKIGDRGYATPFVRFAMVLYEVGGIGRVSASQMAKKLARGR